MVDSRVAVCADVVAEEHGNIHILDLGTGTGAICLAFFTNARKRRVSVPIFPAKLLETAQANAVRNGLAARFEAVQGSWFEAIHGQFRRDCLKSALYTSPSVISTLAPEVKNHDPPAALDGGLDGLDAYRAIAKDAARLLTEDGIVGVEIGYDQRRR